MRDPGGSIEFEVSSVRRCLNEPLSKDSFLNSKLSAELVASGLLVPFCIVDSVTVTSERIPFVTYPFEWCDSQLFEAAIRSLQIQKKAFESSFDLKDGSAWNIVFVGTHAVFCDLLSFTPLVEKSWFALGQFSRHFIVPLAIARRRALHVSDTFKMWRDGVPDAAARSLLGPERFFSRYWPFVAGKFWKSRATSKDRPGLGIGKANSTQTFRAGLHSALEWVLDGLAPRTSKLVSLKPVWLNYKDNRSHYSDASLAQKRHTVDRWLVELRAEWICDLGCNTGEFTDMALASGGNVVAIDADHDSVENLFLSHPRNKKLFPVLANLDDVAGGRGWQGSEFPGLLSRMEGKFDVVMMLALIHHLAISSSIPLSTVAKFCAACTRTWLIVELIDASDPQVQMLCDYYNRRPSEFGISAQLDAFSSAGFEISEQVMLASCHRGLYLMRRHA